MLKAALKYAEMGWHIFPVRPKGKIPLTEHGLNDASNDPERIKAWWQKWPEANIGLNCGMSGLVVIDLDKKPDFNGKDAWGCLRKKLAIDDHTPISHTGGGGLHIFYRGNGHKIRNSAGKLGPGIDVRGDGGYIVLPPSIHPNDAPYKWDYTLNLKMPPVDFPEKLAMLLESPEQRLQENPLGDIPEGQRDNFLFEQGVDWWERDQTAPDSLAEVQLRATLHHLNDSRCKPPMPHVDVEKKVNHIVRDYTHGKKRSKGKGGDIPSDVANAERFTERYGNQVRYQISEKEWFVYDGAKWVEDRAGAILIRAFESVKDLNPRCHSHGKIVSLLEEAKPRLAIEPATFDADPWSLNVLNGTLDLKTGQLSPHSKSDFITRQCPVNFDGAARCPLWLEFLGEIFQGDESLINYVQDVVGYSLTGIISEQVFFMAYGQKAGNGKSTFFSVLRALLGTYAGHTSVETILKQKNYVMPDALAQWDKLRLMTTSEVPEGRQLNEALVKDLTGGEPIKARPLYGEWFDFNPQMKLWIPGNTRPKTSSNRGIMRRAKSIPFNFVVPEHKIDINKVEKLTAELSGILNWSLDGCRRWRLTGFEEPLTVIQSTEEFKDEMNVVRDFIDSCCEKSDQYTTREKLFPLYENWHRKNIGPRPMSGTDFGIGLRELGIDKVRITEPGTGKKLTVYQNIKVTVAAQEEYGDLQLGHTPGHTPNQEGELWR